MDDKNVLNDEKFTSLYNKLYNENFEELEGLRKKEAGDTMKILLPALVVVLFVFASHFVSLVFPIATFVMILIAILFAFANVIWAFIKIGSNSSGSKASYSEVFNEKIISPIIKEAIPESKYFPDKGLTETEYNKGEWEAYDRFYSEDKLIIPLKLAASEEEKTNLQIAEVHTEDRQQDSEGNVSYVTRFYGMAGSVTLPKSINGKIKVKNDGTALFSNDKIKMDMAEFEKLFDVQADDKIKAMQILTSDVMTDMIDVVKATKIKFEFYLKNDKMYIRFHTGPMFELDTLGKTMKFEDLKEYFDITTLLSKVTTDICKTILETEL